MLSKEDINNYNSSRYVYSTNTLCYAPFTNMYLNSWGNIGACWLTLDKAPRYPEKSLKEIWFGEYFSKIRSNLQCNNLNEFCGVCKKRIQDKVYPQVLAKAYDMPYPHGDYPQIMEFELSNLCNLACVMCKGSLSSKIRKDREQLSPMHSPYDDQFVEQLKDFIPHLKEARFNGGEPFLQQICWKIWDLIGEINPEVLITVATNGTLLNDKMKRILEKCRFRVNVSLDSLDKKTYESIRVGSHFETVIENLKFYRDYCHRKNTILSVMVNPMRNNWQEMPEFVRWCTENNYFLWFNTIWRPRHLALWTLPSHELIKIKEFYSQQDFTNIKYTNHVIKDANIRVFKSLTDSQISGWINDQKIKEQNKTDYNTTLNKTKNSKSVFSQKKIYFQFKNTFDWIENKTSKVFSNDMLFFYLNQLSEEEILSQISSTPDDKTLEWVYRVCDYY